MGPAWERMKGMLFRPFSIGTWFSFGFIFALQSCIEGGGGNSFNVPNGGGGNSGGSHHRSGGDDTNNAISHFVHNAFSSISSAHHAAGAHGAAGAGSGDLSNFNDMDPSVLLPVAIGIIVLLIPIFLVLYWLGARGQMMAIRSVAIGRADIGEAWSMTRAAGGPLFRFHLVVLALSVLVFAPLLGGGGFYGFTVYQDDPDHAEKLIPIALALVLVLFVLAIPFLILNGLARNFVAPLMLKDGTSAREAWKKFWSVGHHFIGQIALFFVLRIVFSMLAGIVGVIGGFVTCCLGFLPVLHQTLMAPYYVFERMWTLEILASMGPDFDLRAAPAGAGPQGPGGFGAPPGFGGPGYTPGANPYAPPGAGVGPGGYGAPPAGGFGGGSGYGGGGGYNGGV